MTIGDLIAEGLPGKADWRSRMAEEWGESSPAFQSRTLARYGSDAEGALNPSSWVERAMDAAFDVDLPPVAGLDVAGSESEVFNVATSEFCADSSATALIPLLRKASE